MTWTAHLVGHAESPDAEEQILANLRAVTHQIADVEGNGLVSATATMQHEGHVDLGEGLAG